MGRIAQRAVLGENLVATVSVDADGRRGYQDGRRSTQACECFAQKTGPLDPAAPDAGLALPSPTSTYVLPGQMNDAIHAFEPVRVESSGLGVPIDLSVRRGAPDQWRNPMPARLQSSAERGADEATGACYGYVDAATLIVFIIP